MRFEIRCKEKKRRKGSREPERLEILEGWLEFWVIGMDTVLFCFGRRIALTAAVFCRNEWRTT